MGKIPPTLKKSVKPAKAAKAPGLGGKTTVASLKTTPTRAPKAPAGGVRMTPAKPLNDL